MRDDHKMKAKVKIEDAVGMILSHDVTEIIPGQRKGPAFRKGHKISRADLCHLQRLGKRHLYVLDIREGWLHENDAVAAMAKAFCGPGVIWSGEPVEGKLRMVASQDGLLYVAVEALQEVNMLGQVMCASRHTHALVRRGDPVAAARAIPLVIQQEVIDKAVRIAQRQSGLFRIHTLKKANVGVIITGNEVFSRLIPDRFEPVLRRKVTALGSQVQEVIFAPDDTDFIEKQINRFLRTGIDLVLTTGGMSVDPDDVTRNAVARAGATELTYGAAVLPGAMFMIAYIGSVPVIGVPACGIYHEVTLLDLLLPRVLAGERIGRRQIATLGHGGLCLDCPECRYPLCPFGKGG